MRRSRHRVDGRRSWALSTDWNYTTEPEAGLAQRCMATPRGRVHGGSSAINAMVHTRGDRRCFDGWRALGNPDGATTTCSRCSSVRSGTTAAPPSTAVATALSRSAAVAILMRVITRFSRRQRRRDFRVDPEYDFNVPEPTGVAGFYQRNILNGRRQSAAAAFLAACDVATECRSPFTRSRDPAAHRGTTCRGRRVRARGEHRAGARASGA